MSWFAIRCEVCGELDDLHRIEWADRGPYWLCAAHLNEGLGWHDEGVLLVDGQVSDHEPVREPARSCGYIVHQPDTALGNPTHRHWGTREEKR